MYNYTKNQVISNSVTFDRKIALEYLANSYEAYYSIAISYIKNFANLQTKIDNYLKDKNYYDLMKMIHDIKGTSIYTGCELLHKYSTYLHQKLFNNDFTNLNEELDLMVKLNTIIINYLMEEVKNA